MVEVSYGSLFSTIKNQINNDVEARVLFEHITGFSKNKLAVIDKEQVSQKIQNTTDELIKKRLAGEPLQYIVGMWEFYSLPFYVGEGVLIPRPDTEVLVEQVINIGQKMVTPVILDLCAGSGCIGISIDKNIAATISCIELSPKAFVYLERNKILNESTVRTINADVLAYEPSENVDIIVSNPPYIANKDLERLQIEVKKEPTMALDGGETGLDFYCAIAKRYYAFLKQGGFICFEIGINQDKQVSDILFNEGYKNIEVKKDYSGINRVISAQK